MTSVVLKNPTTGVTNAHPPSGNDGPAVREDCGGVEDEADAQLLGVVLA